MRSGRHRALELSRCTESPATTTGAGGFKGKRVVDSRGLLGIGILLRSRLPAATSSEASFWLDVAGLWRDSEKVNKR
ncbi:hypothetical protein P7K49_007132 [Saguinus oedipus]|uniref:Uncharacterized protein n=1 Tax=Saguinus oedipus TaxID=9490 RepID=A0ABQ9VUN8_SAGOE|nr:hypothetical protein P7K49_007132 [Saguinus oedipus]